VIAPEALESTCEGFDGMMNTKPRVPGKHGNPNWAKGPDGKGVSGNPNGKKAIDPEIRRALEALTPRAVQVLGELLESVDEKIRCQAACVVLDRNLGKAVQAIEHASANGESLNLRVEFVGEGSQNPGGEGS